MCLPNGKVYKDINDHCSAFREQRVNFYLIQIKYFYKHKINEHLMHCIIDNACEAITNIKVKQIHSGVTKEETFTCKSYRKLERL